jgi:hypothetical protein
VVSATKHTPLPGDLCEQEAIIKDRHAIATNRTAVLAGICTLVCVGVDEHIRNEGVEGSARALHNHAAHGWPNTCRVPVAETEG